MIFATLFNTHTHTHSFHPAVLLAQPTEVVTGFYKIYYKGNADDRFE